MVFAIALGVSMIVSIPITYIIIHIYATSDKRALFGDKFHSNEDDNPLLITIQAMEAELAELLENNIHMERIAQLEEQIKEARAHAEALSKVVGNYGSTMEEVGEPIQHTGFTERVDGNTLILSPATDSNGVIIDGFYSEGLVVEKGSIHNAFDDTKTDWKGYVNSLRCNLDLMGGSVLPDSITEGMSLSEYKKFYDFIYEHKALGIGRQFNNKATYSIKTLLSHLSLEDFRNPEAYANEVYDLLLRDKQNYGVYVKVFEQEVFNFEEFRQAVLSYFKEKEEVFDEELARQEFAHFRTCTSQTGWSSYYDVTFK